MKKSFGTNITNSGAKCAILVAPYAIIGYCGDRQNVVSWQFLESRFNHVIMRPDYPSFCPQHESVYIITSLYKVSVSSITRPSMQSQSSASLNSRKIQSPSSDVFQQSQSSDVFASLNTVLISALCLLAFVFSKLKKKTY